MKNSSLIFALKETSGQGKVSLQLSHSMLTSEQLSYHPFLALSGTSPQWDALVSAPAFVGSDNAGGLSLVMVFLESHRRWQRDPAGADGMSPLACHPSVFAPHCSRPEHAPTSLALLCMFLAETWRSLRVVFLKKMLRNIVSSNLSIHFLCHLQTCLCC